LSKVTLLQRSADIALLTLRLLRSLVADAAGQVMQASVR
jgi:hypothetical protein